MVTYVLGCHELEEFIKDIAIKYDMEIPDVVTLLHSFRVHGEPMRRRTVDIIKYVPSPDDYRVDFQHAWGVALHDAKLCNEILSGNPSLAEIIECELNVYRWLRFLSVRCPDLERCIKYRRTADAMAEEFATCRAKAASMNTRNAKLVIERLVP